MNPSGWNFCILDKNLEQLTNPFANGRNQLTSGEVTHVSNVSPISHQHMTRVELQIRIFHRLQRDVLGISIPPVNQNFDVPFRINKLAAGVAPLFRYLDCLINFVNAEKCRPIKK